MALPRWFDALVAVLRGEGWQVVGPTVREGMVSYAPVGGEADLPRGVRALQEPGTYALVHGDDGRCFAFGPGSSWWKHALFPSRTTVAVGTRTQEGVEWQEEQAPPPVALLGIRACDWAAVRILDRVLAADPVYRRRRQSLFVGLAQCTEPAATCFCASLGTGPRAPEGGDLVWTELPSGAVVVRADTPRGRQVLRRLPVRPATGEEAEAEEEALRQACAAMVRRVETDGLPEALRAAATSSLWQDVAARCLGCGNCTMVCPTCFCTAVEDRPDLSLREIRRERRWDSCFNLSYSYVHGGAVRTSLAARYRQWLTHKFCTWVDQFGGLGCVGCGRCVVWCPVRIDVTEELARVRRGDGEGHVGQVRGAAAEGAQVS